MPCYLPGQATFACGNVTPSVSSLLMPRSISTLEPALPLGPCQSPCTSNSGSGSWNHTPGARALFHAQTVARALGQDCYAASLLFGLCPAPVPGRNSLSPARKGPQSLKLCLLRQLWPVGWPTSTLPQDRVGWRSQIHIETVLSCSESHILSS